MPTLKKTVLDVAALLWLEQYKTFDSDVKTSANMGNIVCQMQ